MLKEGQPIGLRSGFLRLLIAASMLLAMAATVPKLSRPFFADEVYMAAAVETLLHTGSAQGMFGGLADWVPPLYYYTATLVCKGLGFSPAAVRLTGLAGLALSCYLIWGIAKSLAPEEDDAVAATLAVVIYLTTPAVLQGSVLAEIDTSFLPPANLALVFVFLRDDRMGRPGSPWLAAIFALTLLIKPTTTLAFLPCLGWAVYQYYGWREGSKVLVRFIVQASVLFVVLLVGIALITGFSPSGPFDHIARQLVKQKADVSSLLHRLARTSFQLMLWQTPFWASLLALIAWRFGRHAIVASRCIRPQHSLALYTLLIIFIYLAIGGMTFGYPRYHYPVFSLAAILFAVSCVDAVRAFPLKALLVVSGIWAVWIVINNILIGDPLWILYVDVGTDLLLERPAFTLAQLKLMATLVLPLLVGSMVFVALRRWQSVGRSVAIRLTLFTGLLAGNVALDIMQAKATYATAYNYGADGMQAIIEYMRAGVREGRQSVLAPIDVTYMVGGTFFVRGHSASKHVAEESFWKQPDLVLRTLIDRKVDYFVTGLRLNTIDALRTLSSDEALQRYLRHGYTYRRIGTYDLWEKEDDEPAAGHRE